MLSAVVFAVSKVYKPYLVFNVSRKRFVLLEYPLYMAVVFFCKLELSLCVARGISSFLEISKKGQYREPLQRIASCRPAVASKAGQSNLGCGGLLVLRYICLRCQHSCVLCYNVILVVR
jgi:hypothetical protein